MGTIVYVHDWIIHKGGAEKILEDLIDQYEPATTKHPAPIFCLFSKKQTFNGHPVITALPQWLNKLFVSANKSRFWIVKWLFDYRNALVFYPQLVWLLRKKITHHNPDTIIISSFAAVKNVIPADKDSKNTTTVNNQSKPALTHPDTTIILYLHSPMQYIRENYKEYKKKIKGVKRVIFLAVAYRLKRRDKRKRTYSKVLCNSTYTLHSAQNDYQREDYLPIQPAVVYPKLPQAFIDTPALKKPFTYYLFVGRLVTYIRGVDTVIKAFNELALPLLIMGTGPDAIQLKKLAGPTITFLGYVDDLDEKVTIIKQAKGLVNIAQESCGIGTMEALSLGVPVLGYNKGGTSELVGSQSGLLLEDRSVENIVTRMHEFEQTTFDRPAIKQQFLSQYAGRQHEIR